MKKTAIILYLLLAAAPIFSAPKADDFSRGIVYYLIGDMELANKNLDAFFYSNPQPSVKSGFARLLKNEKWEATKTFGDYLERDRRSLEALIGISLSVGDIKNSLAIDNLLKVTRMNPGFAPAYLCLGNEYFKRKNYPVAEDNFKKGLQLSKIAESKLLLCELYLQTSQPQKAIELIKPEADLAPANYYFALLAARAFYKMNNWGDLSTYIQQALKVKPDSKEGQLLLAQYFMNTAELKKAKKILEKLKFNYYNLEYGLTFAEVLTKLKDSDAEKYLYEVFSQNQWEPRINFLLGLYHLKKKNSNVQNWLNRAILSGKNPEELKTEFSASFDFQAYPFLAFFDIKKIQWLNNNRVLIAGNMQSGEKEKLLVIDTVALKILKTFDYEGSIQEIFPANNLEKFVFSTTAAENEKVYIYTFIAAANNYSLQPVVGYALKMPTIVVAFNTQASEVYITDGSLTEQAFTSPFSTVAANGRKVAIYPNYPFQVYRYTYANDRWAEIKDRELLRGVPIKQIQQYLVVADALQNNQEVAKMLEKGRDIEITASEDVKIFFGSDPDHFIIYLSDLKNAFQGLVYDHESNKTKKFDETMFLGAKYYCELDIINFNPEKNEILFLTRDKVKNLFLFNYHSLFYKELGEGILAVCVNKDMDTIYFLSERNKYLYFSESNLEIIHLLPFAREKISSRHDLNSIIDCRSSEQYFSTFNGEILKLAEEGNFKNCQVSLAGSNFQPSPNQRKAAVFINGRFYILSWLN